MMRRTLIALATALATLSPLSSQAQAPSANPQEITYLLPAPAILPAFGPWMLAQAKGYYAQEGLNVKFVSGRGGVDVAKQIGAGNAVSGGAIGDTPIFARGQGIPVKAVAVMGAGFDGLKAVLMAPVELEPGKDGRPRRARRVLNDKAKI